MGQQLSSLYVEDVSYQSDNHILVSKTYIEDIFEKYWEVSGVYRIGYVFDTIGFPF